MQRIYVRVYLETDNDIDVRIHRCDWPDDKPEQDTTFSEYAHGRVTVKQYNQLTGLEM